MNGVMSVAGRSLCILFSVLWLTVPAPGAATESNPETGSPRPSYLWVLGPDSHDDVREIGDALGRATGTIVGRVSIDVSMIRFDLVEPQLGTAHIAWLVHHESSLERSGVRFALSVGDLVLPEELAEGFGARVQGEFEAEVPVLEWRQVRSRLETEPASAERPQSERRPAPAAESPREEPPEPNRETPNGASSDPGEAFPFPLWVDLLVGLAAILWLAAGFASQRRLSRLAPQIGAVAAAVVAYSAVRYGFPHRPSLEQVELAVSASFAAGGLVCLVALFVSFFRDLLAWSRKQSIVAWSLGLCALAALLLHVLSPGRVTMVYMGYPLVDSLDLGSPMPRYGGGAVWLYFPFLRLADPSIQSLQLANRVFGLLTFMPMAVFGLSLTLSAGSDRTRPDPRGLVGLLLFTLLPVVLRDHVSEGIITGTTLLLMVAVAALVRAQWAGDGGWRVILALPVLGWAVVSRPEMAAVAVVMVVTVGLVILRSSGRTGLSRGAYGLWAASLALWLVPHVGWLWNEASRQVAGDAILSLTNVFGIRFVLDNIFLHGSVIAAPVLLWWAAGLFTKRDRVWLAGVSVMALVWVAQTQVDLPRVSIPRVHMPALVLLCGTVGVGVRALATRPRFANVAIGLAVIVTGLVSLHSLMSESNADYEDELFRTALTALPPEDGCLAVVLDDDPPPPGKTHRYVPEAMFQSHTVIGLERLYREWERCGPTVAVLGTRCYAQLRAEGEPAPGPPGILPVCETFRERFDLDPIVERTIPNRTANTFPMYPDVATLDVGVYVVVRKNE